MIYILYLPVETIYWKLNLQVTWNFSFIFSSLLGEFVFVCVCLGFFVVFFFSEMKSLNDDNNLFCFNSW